MNANDLVHMNANEFVEEAMRTDLADYTPVIKRFGDAYAHQWPGARITHAALGVASEAGELADAVKKHLMYGREIDRVNLQEECGDILWYLALLADACGFTLGGAMAANINKLRVRYPDKFSEAHATNRDLTAERAALEGKGNTL
jgi:NTP pyrophosphatase (non-canonical NTP hydrolase)